MSIERRDGYRMWVSGPVPRGRDAVTIGRTIITRAEPSPYVLRRETVHLRQWRRHRAPGYVTRYAGWYLLWRARGKGHQGALLRVPLEIEADWVARRSLSTAVGADAPVDTPSDRPA